MILWNDDKAVGIRELDEQHRTFYALANELHAAIRNGDRTAVVAFSERIVAFARHHFATEEGHMRLLRYPDLDAHRAEHARFIDGAERIGASLREGFRPSLVVELSTFVTGWIGEHLRGPDRAFGRFVAAHASSLRDAVRAAAARDGGARPPPSGPALRLGRSPRAA